MFCFWLGQSVQMLSADLLTYWRVLPVYFLVLAWAVRAQPGARAVNILFVDQFSDLGRGATMPAGARAGHAGSRLAHRHARFLATASLIEKLRDLGVTVNSLRVARLAAGRKPPLDFLRFGFDQPLLALEFPGWLREIRADLIYVNGPRMLPAAAWAARKAGRPLVFHCHNHLSAGSAPKLAGLSLQFAAARVIACCRYVARPLWPYVDPRPHRT